MCQLQDSTTSHTPQLEHVNTSLVITALGSYSAPFSINGIEWLKHGRQGPQINWRVAKLGRYQLFQ